MPTATDLVTDLPADFEVFGQAVATSMGDLLGGTTGQILSKATNTDMDFTWVSANPGDITAVNTTAPLQGGATSGAVTLSIDTATTSAVGAVQLTNSTSSTSTTTAAVPANVKTAYDLAAAAIPNSLVDAKGDVVTATADNTPARIAIGANDTVLTADSTTLTGLKWAAPASSSPLTTKGDLYTYSTTNARLAVGADYGFLQADAAAATGNKWNSGAWTTYTPTLTSSSGTATTTSVTGRYIRIGKMCVVENDIYITNKGTAAGNMMVTLPFTARANAYVGSAMENSVIGVVCRCYVAPSENKINLCQYDGVGLLWVNGYGIYSTIAFEVA